MEFRRVLVRSVPELRQTVVKTVFLARDRLAGHEIRLLFQRHRHHAVDAGCNQRQQQQHAGKAETLEAREAPEQSIGGRSHKLSIPHFVKNFSASNTLAGLINPPGYASSASSGAESVPARQNGGASWRDRGCAYV